MTESCYDDGAIQAFLDGELASEASETVARHVAVCDDCAIRLADAEDETAFAFAALDQELNALVPTVRLWTKINDSIAREKKPFWQPIFAFLFQPQTAAFAGLLLIAVFAVALFGLKNGTPINEVALENGEKQTIVQAIAENQQSPITQIAPVELVEKKAENINYNRNKNEFQADKAIAVKPKVRRAINNQTLVKTAIVGFSNAENLAGEESYVKTISTLTATVDNRKDEVLSPSARFAYERDLAVTDDAIVKMKQEVRRNPKNDAAKQILRASYQNKIDLLNSVADKTELMASLK